MKIYADDVCPSKTTSLARNIGRRTVFSKVQPHSFFDHASLPMSMQRRTSVTGRCIYFLALTKAHLVSMDTAVGDSRDPEREKAVTFFSRYFSLTDA